MRLFLDIVTDSGIWGNTGNHRFLLSPDVYRVNEGREAEFARLGKAIRQVFLGLDALICRAVSDVSLSGNHSLSQCLRLNRVGVPESYRRLEAARPGSIPSFCKVDFMEGEDGVLRIAEIDGHNKHGLGFSTLAARLAACAEPGGRQFPGVLRSIENALFALGEDRLTVLCGDHEVFYVPEMKFFAREMARHGIGVDVVLESDYEKRERTARVVSDLPFLHRKASLPGELAQRYLDGKMDFLLPPKPWTGSKALLALVRNDHGDTRLEKLLREYIPADALDTLRAAIPETYLVYGNIEHLPIGSAQGFVGKEVVSSGMKGTLFSEDPRFESAVKRASRSRGRMILQREVANRGVSYRYFTSEGKVKSALWYQRITVHYDGRGDIADMVVTARQDKRVHGAPDCLQLGAVRI